MKRVKKNNRLVIVIVFACFSPVVEKYASPRTI